MNIVVNGLFWLHCTKCCKCCYSAAAMVKLKWPVQVMSAVNSLIFISCRLTLRKDASTILSVRPYVRHTHVSSAIPFGLHSRPVHLPICYTLSPPRGEL